MGHVWPVQTREQRNRDNCKRRCTLVAAAMRIDASFHLVRHILIISPLQERILWRAYERGEPYLTVVAPKAVGGGAEVVPRDLAVHMVRHVHADVVRQELHPAQSPRGAQSAAPSRGVAPLQQLYWERAQMRQNVQLEARDQPSPASKLNPVWRSVLPVKHGSRL